MADDLDAKALYTEAFTAWFKDRYKSEVPPNPRDIHTLWLAQAFEAGRRSRDDEIHNLLVDAGEGLDIAVAKVSAKAFEVGRLAGAATAVRDPRVDPIPGDIIRRGSVGLPKERHVLRVEENGNLIVYQPNNMPGAAACTLVEWRRWGLVCVVQQRGDQHA